MFITLSQTGLSIPISAGPNRRGYCNNIIDESVNTHLDLHIKTESILADRKFNVSNQKYLAFNIDTTLMQSYPHLHPKKYVILTKLIHIPMENNLSISNLVF